MSYFNTCPDCGAHLDSGERCDCRDDLKAQLEAAIMDLTESERAVCLRAARLHKQHPDWSPEECVAAADTRNTSGGGVEHGDSPVPSYHN